MSEPISGDHDLVYEVHRAAQRYGSNQAALVAAYRETRERLERERVLAVVEVAAWDVARRYQYAPGSDAVRAMLQAVSDAIAKLRSGI